LAEYRRAGISATLIDALHMQAARQIERAEQRRAQMTAWPWLATLQEAWSNETARL